MEEAQPALEERIAALERRAADEFVTLKELEQVTDLLEKQREEHRQIGQRVLELSVQTNVQELVIGHLATQVPNLDAVMAAMLEDQDRFLQAKTPEARQLLMKELQQWHTRLLYAKRQART